MSSCKKCRAGPLSVHILSNGFCQGCTNELSWKQGDRVARKMANRARRMAMYKQGEKIIKKNLDSFYKEDIKEKQKKKSYLYSRDSL